MVLFIVDGGPDIEGDLESVPSLTIRKKKRGKIWDTGMIQQESLMDSHFSIPQRSYLWYAHWSYVLPLFS